MQKPLPLLCLLTPCHFAETTTVVETTSTTVAPAPEVEMCKTSTAHVNQCMYVISPGYKVGQYPVNVHCGLTVATSAGKVGV